MTLATDKIRILFLLIDLVIKTSAFIQRRRRMTAFGAGTRGHWHSECLRVDRIQPRRRMAIRAREIRMRTTFMTIGAGGESFAPGVQRDAITDSHRRRHAGIEVTGNSYSCVCKLVTRLTVGRDR